MTRSFHISVEREEDPSLVGSNSLMGRAPVSMEKGEGRERRVELYLSITSKLKDISATKAYTWDN